MNLAWIDLETTGADEQTGSILEIGCIVTDDQLRPLDRFETLVHPAPRHLDAMSDTVREMHTASGLLDELEEARANPADGHYLGPDVADAKLRSVLGRWTVRGQIALAGSGVGHFDSRWIRRHLPITSTVLTYWTYDVGVVRRWLYTLVGCEPAPYTTKPHRAMADIADHLQEAVRYRDALRAASDVISREITRPRPGDRTTNGDEPGVLVRCPECSGDGLLHRPDQIPPTVTPDG